MFEKLQSQKPFDPSLVLSHVQAFKNLEISVLDSDQLLKDSEKNEHQKVLIVCPGPSSKDKLENGKTRLETLVEQDDYKIVLVGSAVRFLYDGTLRADQVDGVVFSNPESAFEGLFQGEDQIKNFPFFVATHCKPEVFFALQDHNAVIQPYNVHVAGVTEDLFKDELVIGSGWGAAVSAISLMAAMGHRDFEAVGWDGMPEYAVDLSDMPDYQADLEKRSTVVQIGDKTYSLYEDFGGDVPEIISFVEQYPQKIKSLFLHGNGPSAALLNADAGPRRLFENMRVVPEPVEPS